MRPEDEETWRRAVLRLRERKDEFLRQSHDSPLAHADQPGFTGLKYFEPDPAYRLEAKLQRHQAAESAIMTTSKGSRQLYNKVGHFDLTIGGEPVRLQAYQSAER